MYYSHATTTIALRAKWSIVHCNDFGFGARWNPGTCTACSQSSLHVSSRNPRFSYYGHLLKNCPIFCQLPRRVVRFRVCEESEPFCRCRCFVNNGFHVNFVEKDENCNRTRSNLVKGSAYFDDFEDSGDEYRKYYRKERSSSERTNLGVRSGDGKKEVHDLQRHEDGRKVGKHLNNEANQEVYRREVRDQDQSTVSGNNLSSLRDYDVRRVEHVKKCANSGDCFSRDTRNDRNRRVSDRKYRDEEGIFLDTREHTTNKKHSTRSIEFENDSKNYSSKKNSNHLGNIVGGRVVGNSKGFVGSVDEEERVVRKIQKNKNDEVSFRSALRKETNMEDFNHKTVERDDKTTYSFRKGSIRNVRNEDYVYNEQEKSKKLYNEQEESRKLYNEQEESRKLIKSRIDDRYNRSSIDDHRRENFMHSQHDSDMRYMDKGESSKSYVERQYEIDKQVKSQADVRKSSFRSDNGVNKATSLVSVKNPIVTKNKRTQIDESEFGKVNVNTLYGTYDYDSNIHNASTSTSHTDSGREDEISLSSHRHVEDETIRKDSIASSVENRVKRDVINEMDAMEQYRKQTNASLIFSSGTERVSSGTSHLEMREDKQEEFLTSKFDPIMSGIKRNDSETVSNLLEESIIRTKNQQETSSTELVLNNSNKQQRLQSTAQVGTSSSVNQYMNDAIESARRLDESSSMYVGDFVNNLRQEASASNNHEETSTVRHESENQSSLRYRNRGPSDEMWELRATTSMESSKTEEAKNDSSNSEVSNVDTAIEVVHGNIITKRAHKSLWTYIADIMKIGLGHRSDTSTQKSRRSSSNASVNSEAYFSGEELDEDKDSAEKEKSFDRSTHVSHEEPDRRNITIEQPLLPLRRKKSPLIGDIGKENVRGSGSPKPIEELEKENIAITRERRDELEKTRSDPHVGGSTFIPIIRSAFSSRGGDMSQSQQGKGSSTVTIALTPPSVPEIGSINVPSNDLPKLEEITSKEESEGGMSRKKLRRSKQVMTTQFEEWEEAYKREREQRLVDELFMREALLEAKKAADSWEVPVGAVLVQNGKIIARGCNLVEELRDSTAHAEMICIRQASNILKSWRLAETTLYVTLEPCAMCAGAILQARVDTVVWGAPNKLLGADGSWVRLFPNGDEGTSSNLSDSTNQNVGPVHPFHPKITIRRGILAAECSDTMQQFFQLRRKKVKKEETPPPPSISMSAAPVKLLGRFHNLLAAMFCL